MTLSGVVAWVGADLKQHKARTFVGILGVSVGVMALVFFMALGRGIEAFARGPQLTEADATLFEVVPKSMELGIFRLNRPGLLGNQGLDPALIDRLRKVQGVRAVYPKRLLRLPMLAQGGGRLIGKDMATDLFAEGIDRALLARDIPEASLDWKPGQPLPVVVNNELLQLFNGSVAEAMSVPKLGKDAVLGFGFDIVVGRSFLMGQNGAKRSETMRGHVVGFSPWAMRLGMSVPLDVVDALEREFRTEDSAPIYTAAVIALDDASKLPSVASALDKVGLKISDAARRTADAVRLATLFLVLIAVLVLVLATFNIGHGFVAQIIERRAELALLKALGATPLSVLSLILTQAIALGVIGGAIGVSAGYGIALATESALSSFVSEIPIRPERFFIFDVETVLTGIATAVIAATLGALIPALRVLSDSPARVLSSVEN
jgi:putative ABC transport system permease protein